MRPLRCSLALCSALVLLGACGTSPGEDACEAFIDAYSKRVVDDCGMSTRAAVRADIFRGFSSLGVDECSDFTKVRDETSFYGECLPGVEVLECSTLGPLPSACNSQLLVVR